MQIVLKRAAAVAAAFAMSAAAVLAADPSPEGVWEAKDGESRYTVSLCGDGQALCAHVSWVKPEAITDANRALLAAPLFENLPPTGPNRWHGNVQLLGRTVRGTVELFKANRIRVTACIYLVLCDSTVLKRVPDEG